MFCEILSPLMKTRVIMRNMPSLNQLHYSINGGRWFLHGDAAKNRDALVKAAVEITADEVDVECSAVRLAGIALAKIELV